MNSTVFGTDGSIRNDCDGMYVSITPALAILGYMVYEKH